MKQSMTWLLAVAGFLIGGAVPALATTTTNTTEADGKAPFADVDGTVHELDVAALKAAGITSGCAEWLFCPDDPVTRGEMAAFLTRGLELSAPDLSTFGDTVDSRFQRDVEAIAAAAITFGCGDGRFCPDKPVTRGQMASLLVRALDLPPADRPAFDDVSHSVHAADIAALATAGLTHGCAEDRYCPDEPVTRAQMASFLARGLELDPPAELATLPIEVVESLQAPSVPTGPGAEGWRPLVEMYFPDGDVDRAIRIMQCESKGEPDARNRRSGASGLFQHMPRYWDERASGAGFSGASIFDPEANIAAAAYLIYDHPGGGWKHWVCK